MVTVALDVGPLHGHRTGIGNAVAWILDELEDRPALELVPYVTSARATLTPPQRRLPIPAALAHRLWARRPALPMDRWLGGADVVHGSNYVVPPARCPRIVSVYDCWFLEHPELAGPYVRRAGAALRRAVADGAEVLTSSDATADKARALLGSDRVRSVHLGPPPTTPSAEPPGTPTGRATTERLAGNRFLLALGTIERRKNLTALVDAFERVAADSPDVLLVIAGSDGNESERLAARVDRLEAGVAGRVVRLHAVDATLKAWLLRHAAALAYPSLDEGFGFPILEAQQAGTPVVGSDAGSIAEIAGTAALLCPPDDVEALSTNLLTVLDDEACRTRLVDIGRQNVGRFSWQATGDAYEALYYELAGRPR